MRRKRASRCDGGQGPLVPREAPDRSHAHQGNAGCSQPAWRAAGLKSWRCQLQVINIYSETTPPAPPYFSTPSTLRCLRPSLDFTWLAARRRHLNYAQLGPPTAFINIFVLPLLIYSSVLCVSFNMKYIEHFPISMPSSAITEIFSP